jgi:hypothetical protein
VKFHATPGIELLAIGEKSRLITGDGIYEETWLAPHEWRREVTLANYHAVEVDHAGVRKMQANSDYEPSRVLMLMEALLNPISRSLLSRDLGGDLSDWKIENKNGGRIPFVLISNNISNKWTANKTVFINQMIFLPNGLLIQSNQTGLITGWQDDIAFAGKVVPRRISVEGAGKDLLNADVTVEEAGKLDPAIFELPGGPAEPGMTLRPLHKFDTARFMLLPKEFGYLGNRLSPNAIRVVVDRHGMPQEMEVITAVDPDHLDMLAEGIRSQRWDPGEIDGSPCELSTVLFHGL